MCSGGNESTCNFHQKKPSLVFLIVRPVTVYGNSSKKLLQDVTTYDRTLILHLIKNLHNTVCALNTFFVDYILFFAGGTGDKSKETMSTMYHVTPVLYPITVMSVAMGKCFPTPHRFKVMWNTEAEKKIV